MGAAIESLRWANDVTTATTGAPVSFSVDINKLFDSAIAAVAQGRVGKLFVIIILLVVMSPLIIPPLGRALNAARQIDTKHVENMSKIRNSRDDRAERARRAAAKKGELR